MSRLDDIKARSEALEDETESVFAAVCAADAIALVAAIEAVLKQHRSVEWLGEDNCYNCTDHEGYPVNYPCETVEAIRTALGETE